MRLVLIAATLVALVACTSDKFSSVPEPSGPWVLLNAPAPQSAVQQVVTR